MEAFSVLMGTCQSLCRYVLFCLFFSSRLPSFYLVGIFLSAYISYQSPRFCLCYCFSSLSAFWGQGTGCVALFYSMASTILSRKSIHDKLLLQLNWTFETSQIGISEFSFWRWHSLLSHSTQLLIVILPCVCVESDRQTDRDRCKGGWGRSSIKSRTATWIGGRELEIKEFFLLEKRTFLFPSETINRSLWERWNQNPQPKWAHRQRNSRSRWKNREACAGTEHLGEALVVWDLGKISMARAQGRPR